MKKKNKNEIKISIIMFFFIQKKLKTDLSGTDDNGCNIQQYTQKIQALI